MMLMEGSYAARIAEAVRRHLEARLQWVSFDAIVVFRQPSVPLGKDQARQHDPSPSGWPG